MSIEINNESGVDVDEVALVELGRFVLDSLRIDPLAELSIVLLDAEAMAALHVQWMDLPGTDRRDGVPDGRRGPVVRACRSVRAAAARTPSGVERAAR